jgi:hypothetical protein
MSLTLARLCREWRLVSEIYGDRSGKYEACIVIIRFQPPIILSRNIAISSGKYKARIVIFRIFAAVDRFFPDFLESGKLLRKIRKPLRKIENLKAVTEIRNALKRVESR